MSYAYRKDQHGSLLCETDNGQLVHQFDPSDILSIAHDGPVLLKHGPKDMVTASVGKLHSTFKTGGHAQLALGIAQIDIEVGNLTDPMIEEINACLATSGRVEHLADRLEKMSKAGAPEPM